VLVCAPTGARNWVLRIQADGKRRDIGLGALDADGAGRKAFGAGDSRMDDTPIMLRKSLTLAEAREKAAALRRLAKAGADPVLERDKERRKVPTFAEAVKDTHDALKSGWSEKTAKAFLATMKEHATPKREARPDRLFVERDNHAERAEPYRHHRANNGREAEGQAVHSRFELLGGHKPINSTTSLISQARPNHRPAARPDPQRAFPD